MSRPAFDSLFSQARLCLCCAIAAAVLGCSERTEPPQANPLLAPPVDTSRIGSFEQVLSWKHRRVQQADLDGDAQPEAIVLAADVQLDARGAPLWEDGHRWAVWAEGKGAPTLLYAAFVPNGHVEAAVLSADSQGRRHVLVEERTPAQVRALVVAYERPGAARSVSAAHYQVEQWLPALHAR
jgi:hypothetical protein